MLRIVKYPHPALRYESVPVQRIDDSLRDQVRAMFDLMYEHQGIGLAANQVALPFRFFVLNVSGDATRRDEELVLINPEIVKRHSSVEEEEGCLSFPGLYAPVRRARKIKVRAFDLNAQPIELDADDLLSRAIQHETDHLSGRLFIDLLDKRALATVGPRIQEYVEAFRRSQAQGEIASDAALTNDLDALSKRLGDLAVR